MKNFLLIGLAIIVLIVATVIVKTDQSSYVSSSGGMVLGVGGSAPTNSPIQTTSINDVDLLTQDGNFTIFLEALKNEGLLETLSGPAKYTILAPQDSAFASLDEDTITYLLSDQDTLRKFLMHHIAQGAITDKDLASDSAVQMLDGSKVNTSAITKSRGIVTSNGVIYKINQVLIPTNLLPQKPQGS
ncbi:MAG TPA: fasciclin domain-containing protein [Patescibacteria group bacterium]|nr:fasciclin domain-containing protein [Patescibacteria group bacterium]